MGFLPDLAAGARQFARRFLVRAAFALACALSVAIGLGFASNALFQALRLQYDVVEASIGLGAIYLIAAGILYLCYRHAAPAPVANTSLGRSQGQAGNAEASAAPQMAALATSIELVRQMTPLQLTMLAVISGFVAGRRL